VHHGLGLWVKNPALFTAALISHNIHNLYYPSLVNHTKSTNHDTFFEKEKEKVMYIHQD